MGVGHEQCGRAGEPNAQAMSGTLPIPRKVTFAEAFRYWLKLGFINFGGPAGQIALMHRDLVERRKWISEERFLHALNYCMLLPGPEAQQLAIYVGWLMHRAWGGIVAGTFFVIPSIFVLLGLSYTYAAYGNVPAVAGALSGFKPVVVAIVVEAILRIGGRALKGPAHFVIAAAAFVSIYFLHIPFPLIVVGAGIAGFVGERSMPRFFAAGKTKDAAEHNPTAESIEIKVESETVIDDTAPPPAHTVPSAGRALRVLSTGLALWILPFLVVIAWRGSDSVHMQEYRFFTQAALVTFGGAYAALAYVTQAAAENYGWITHTQAIDGLALAETTPGPLIMVLQFIGFMAGWNNPGSMTQTASAITGALITTYATFLPSFIFIFLGAPYIEVLRGNRKLTSMLSGVTAAVVGVILNLALVFGLTVIWPHGFNGETDWFAAVISVLAFIVFFRLKVDVLWVVLAGGLVGLVRVLFFT
jgi:chromate transporter